MLKRNTQTTLKSKLFLLLLIMHINSWNLFKISTCGKIKVEQNEEGELLKKAVKKQNGHQNLKMKLQKKMSKKIVSKLKNKSKKNQKSGRKDTKKRKNEQRKYIRTKKYRQGERKKLLRKRNTKRTELNKKTTQTKLNKAKNIENVLRNQNKTNNINNYELYKIWRIFSALFSSLDKSTNRCRFRTNKIKEDFYDFANLFAPSDYTQFEYNTVRYFDSSHSLQSYIKNELSKDDLGNCLIQSYALKKNRDGFYQKLSGTRFADTFRKKRNLEKPQIYFWLDILNAFDFLREKRFFTKFVNKIKIAIGEFNIRGFAKKYPKQSTKNENYRNQRISGPTKYIKACNTTSYNLLQNKLRKIRSHQTKLKSLESRFSRYFDSYLDRFKQIQNKNNQRMEKFNSFDFSF